jgi:hypothetical protein
MIRSIFLTCLASMLSLNSAWAATEAVTSDGKRVLLYEDRSWAYAEDAGAAPASDAVPEEGAAPASDTEPPLVLTVEQRINGANSCKLGLRLQNNSLYPVGSIVPQFSAYNAQGVLFETVFVDFKNFKPTLSKFREARFQGISCTAITELKVHGADRCKYDQYDQYNADNGECLALIKVVPSDMINIFKAP